VPEIVSNVHTGETGGGDDPSPLEAFKRLDHGVVNTYVLSARRLEVVPVSTSTIEEQLSEEELAGLELVRETGGIHQSEFWKELDVSSRQGSRIVDALVDHGLVEREETIYEGHNTYYITPAPRDLDFSLLMAGDMLSPFIGEEEVDFQSEAFSQWMMNLAYEE